MLTVLRQLFWAFARMLLALRYRVHTRGLKQLQGLPGPVLILPNHPAYIDPPLVLGALWPALRPRPLIYEGFFRNPGYFRTPLSGPLIQFLGALLVPDLDRPSARARARAEQAVARVVAGLRRGDNYILWPAGHIQRDGVERLRAARALTEILQAVPEATVVLVRTRGLRGSMFSYARTGSRPHIMARLGAGAGWLLSNLLLLMPRRPVDITVEVLDRGRLPDLQRAAVNRWFETWYNADGPEGPTFVPYHFLLGPRSYEFPDPPGAAGADVSRVTPATKAEVAHILERKLRRPLSGSEQQAETRLDELGLDSLDGMGVVLDVEQRFGVSSEQAPLTVGELWVLAQGLGESGAAQPAPAGWFRPPADDGPPTVEGDTIAEAFVARALACRNDVAVADAQAGVVTYERLLVAALVLARRFAELSGTRVGLLLPASVACDTAFLALQLAGKVPVVLNWTTGPAYLTFAARSMGLTHVVTSDHFLDRTGVQVDGVRPVCLEDLREGVGRWELLRTSLAVRLRPGRIRRRVPRAPPEQPAVILFTSGSEKAPKAVPLTPRNLLSNERACLAALELTRRDAILGFLPAFHSFGLAVTGLLPLLAGIRVVRHPDPTAAATLARAIAAYRPTILAGTPTFISAIFGRAEPVQLQSLRLVCVGAETCPPSLAERCRELVPGACLLEGYGITECAPVVAMNRPTANRPGAVGQALPGVDVRVVDADTGVELPPGRVGELWVSGPNVFPGYLTDTEQQPFREGDGKRWYVTGDLAEVDAEGFIRLCGRKKRFLKAGGEMISLPALEEPFARRYPPTESGPRVAVEGVETAKARRIVLFCREPLSLREANAVLLEEGFRGVMRFDEVREVAAIPRLGTGKIDYRALRALIAAADPSGAAPPRTSSAGPFA
jgi:long-chain-fatty-acid--[acyl-carrier-protein] ligase